MLNGSTEVGPGLLCTGGDACACVCMCVRPSQLPGAPPEASPGLEARQDLRPKGLGGNGGVPDLRLPSLPKKSPTDFEI